jgi:hypothetical protein
MVDAEDLGKNHNDLPFSKEIIETELEFNRKIFSKSFLFFQQKFKSPFDALKLASPNGAIQSLANERVISLLRAVTHDLLRYAVYQRIPFNSEVGRYSICPAMRASVFTKWGMLLRPYTLDSVNGQTTSAGKWIAKYCNELGAIAAASVSMSCITGEKDGKAVFLAEILKPSELEVFLYHLRYRIKHQDSYSLFYRRIKEQYSA